MKCLKADHRAALKLSRRGSIHDLAAGEADAHLHRDRAAGLLLDLLGHGHIAVAVHREAAEEHLAKRAAAERAAQVAQGNKAGQGLRVYCRPAPPSKKGLQF